MSPNKPSALGTVREFQSEVDAIGEATEPPWARVTVFVLTGLFVSVIALMFLTRIDRVVTSTVGKLVSMQLINVFQALDPSIIKSINVHEGDEVEQGQLLATLDPTFAAADVKQLKLQVAGLQAQIERDQAQRDLCGDEPSANTAAACRASKQAAGALHGCREIDFDGFERGSESGGDAS